MTTTSTNTLGYPTACRAAAAALYAQAVGAKFAVAIPQHAARSALLTAGRQPAYAFAALDGAALVGLAGFPAAAGSLTGGITFRLLRTQLGLARSLRAAAVFSLFARGPEPGELVMDGIAVRADQRGQGSGWQLLDQLAHYARAQGYARIRLDVIDANLAARRLYERQGFRPVAAQHFLYLQWLLGCGAATQMELRLPAAGPA